ncbi:MAG: ABC transporter ATP-binding protein [Deltaproteobacteria bacterium]|nr:ABC transporter ATP-binding protein [Deltaproteobacteria bacterium]
MLKIDNLESGYGPMQVLWGANLKVENGSITALLGPNGAGKSTLLRSIMATIKPWSGNILYKGEDITFLAPHKKVQMGITLVPEGKHLFTGMTVRENLIIGAYRRKFRYESREFKIEVEKIFSLFPVLKNRVNQMAGTLSGGEQQMLTIARGLMTKPNLMMLDEPSQGLAPKLVREVFAAIERLKKETGLTILMVEQNAEYSLAFSDYAYIMHEGRIEAEGRSQEIKESEVRKIYLGV